MTRREGVVVPALPQIVLALVDHHGATDDVVLALQVDHAVFDVNVGYSGGVGVDVAEVADVAHLVLGSSMVYLEEV